MAAVRRAVPPGQRGRDPPATTARRRRGGRAARGRQPGDLGPLERRVAPQQATGFVEHDAELVGLLEGLDAATRADLRVEVGRLPQPVPLETAAAMRLNEVAHHGWDVRVGLDPSATLDEAAADVLLTLYAGPLAMMLGFTTKPDELSEPARVEAGAWVLVVDDGVRLEPAGGETTATFTGAPEALARLITGRLGPQHTPAGTEVSGNVDLDDLRRVFAGY